MDLDSLLNDVVRQEEVVPQFKAPVPQTLIKRGQIDFSDFVPADLTAALAERPALKAPAKVLIKGPAKKPAKPSVPADLGPEVPALPTTGPKVVKVKAEKAVKAVKAEEEEAVDEAVEPEKAMKALFERAKAAESQVKIGLKTDAFVPMNRKMFKSYILAAYAPYKLLPLAAAPDPDACAKAAAESKSSLKMFQYQQFVRDYIQRASPYRGILVYHGLGSGKTCASIASMEALYQKGQYPLYVFTPASLEENYRGDITKCGPFMFRTNNFWTWFPILNLKAKTPEAEMSMKLLNMPLSLLRKQKGVWIPDPSKRVGKDFEELKPEEKAAVRNQIRDHMDSRIQFKHYNGLSVKTLKAWACDTPHMFDGSTVVIDEVHNLVRLINNSNLGDFYTTEPADLSQYIPKYCEKGKKYRIAYLLYRMLCNAVGCKIIALSATPIINVPQEVAILANMLAGDTRMVETSVPGISAEANASILKLLNGHDEVDFAEVASESGNTVIRFTPVPSGCTKIFDPATKAFKGFLRQDIDASAPKEILRERDLDDWFSRIKEVLKSKGIVPAAPSFRSLQRLPDTENEFGEIFINKVDLKVKDDMKGILSNRLAGLISFYKGGKADFMAQVTSDEVVYVEMSDKQLEQYTEKRNEEILRERKKKVAPKAGVAYEEVTKNQNTTFKIFSRAVCNFAFPEGFERPYPSDFREAYKLTGEKGGKVDAKGQEQDEEALLEAEANQAEYDDDEEGIAPGPVVPPPPTEAPTTYDLAISEIFTRLKSPESKPLFSKDNLKEMSPKFQAVLTKLGESAGPVLIYSNFKKLEGVGLLAVSLEAQLDYSKLDIVKTATGWALSPESLANSGKKNRYIVYTGDENKEKRSVLLKIYNGAWSKLPSELVAQVQEMAGVKTNLHGEIVKVIMITQTGAEGISLSNVRQVHILEPYWNYVRLDQVKGRAVRICSHMDLPPEERKVDIFTYIAKFGKGQKIDETLKNMDGGISTDEQILRLFMAKKQLADSIMDIMKSSAVDCELMETENGGIACYKLPGKPDMTASFNPDIKEHLSESAGMMRVAKGGQAPPFEPPL